MIYLLVIPSPKKFEKIDAATLCLFGALFGVSLKLDSVLSKLKENDKS